MPLFLSVVCLTIGYYISFKFQYSNNHTGVDPEYESVDDTSNSADNNVKTTVGYGAQSKPQIMESNDFRNRMVCK